MRKHLYYSRVTPLHPPRNYQLIAARAIILAVTYWLAVGTALALLFYLAP